MGLTKKFRNKKNDQETQSPVIKVFKDMMHRSDNANNPEKINLIKSRHEKKTRRYTRSKVKPEEKSDDTSGTCADRNYSVMQNQQPPQSFSKIRSTIFPAAPAPAPEPEGNPKTMTDSKTDSKMKCMWKGSGISKVDASKDDTCSCMTCALRKLTKPQRQRLICIAAILLITLIVAMYFILRPSPPKKCRDLTKTYEILAKTLQPESGDKRDRRSQYELDGKGTGDRSVWDDSKSRLLSGLSDLYGSDFSDGNLREGTLHEANPPEPSAQALTDLSNVLDPNKISEGYSSRSLRNFYKKLIQTDMQIKNLKKSIRDIKSLNDYTDLNPSRSKRSLKNIAKANSKNASRVGRDDLKELTIFFPPACAFKVTQPTVNKVKREFNYSSPSGIMIEKQKLVLEYQPKTKVAKCSHTPKDSKTKVHESEHKHPFYKHSERLDDILDRLLANPKLFPESILDKLKKAKVRTSTLRSSPSAPPAKAEPICCPAQGSDLALLVKRVKHPHGSDYILSTENIFELKHQKPQASCVSVPDPSGVSPIAKAKTTASVTVATRLRFFQEYEPRHREDKNTEGSEVDIMQEHLQKVKQQFNGALSVSTLINGNKMPEEKKMEVQRMPGHRRLLQYSELPNEVEVQRVGAQRLMHLDEVPEETDKAQLISGYQGLLQHSKEAEEKVQHQQASGRRRLLQHLEDVPEKKVEVQTIPDRGRLLKHQEEVPEGKDKVQWRPGHQRLQVDLEEPGDKVKVQMPGYRRLLQVDLEEDRWEADLTGDEVKRTRRMGQLQAPRQIKKNFYSIDTHNPNWKDTMPLYPDELNAIIKQAAMQNYNRVMPINSDNTVTKDMTDTEYVEDYANNKYDKLVKMAQAYSDYGVLDDKKEMRNDKTGKGIENRVKLSAPIGLGFFGRLKKSKTEKHYEIPEEVPVLIEREGIRFEFKPNPRSDANESSTPAAKHIIDNEHMNEVFQFGKHVKIASNTPKNPYLPTQTHTPILKSFDFMTPAYKASSSKPVKQTRVSERGLFFFGPHRRSLKSVDVEDEEDDGATETYNFNNTTNLPNTTQEAVIPIDDEEFKTEPEYSTASSFNTLGSTDRIETTVNKLTTENIASKNISDFNVSMIPEIENLGLNFSTVAFEEFYEEIADWIVSMAETVPSENNNISNDTSGILNLEKDAKPDPILFIPLPPFPILGPESVRHRKRKLMSVEENQNNVTSENEDDKEMGKGTEETIATDVTNLLTGVPTQATTGQLNKIENASNVEENIVTNNVANVDNKTIVKRSAPDANLIFWNDIYDEEYGVKDPLDDSIRDKHSAKLSNELISKPRSWIGVKLRNIADRVRKTARNTRLKSISDPVTIRNKVNKRSDKAFEEPPEKFNFVALTANMKKVCREAAKAVHETKSSEVRSRSEAASTLMQQLVGLMSDLVEIQVQQKTCVQLPPDLQQFLVWLTSPNSEESNQPSPSLNQDTASETYPPGGLPTEIFREIPTPATDLLPSSTDVRTECLGTIHDVQRLITLYDGMSEEDKSKMSGVREYLENQLDFLHKQLSGFEGFYDTSMFHRIRRQTPKRKRLRRMKRKIHRFIKNFGKKRTRSTVTYDAFETYTDSFNIKTGRNEINAIKDDKVKDETKGDKRNDEVKRNLPDVYYRALAESRNFTIKTSSTKSA